MRAIGIIVTAIVALAAIIGLGIALDLGSLFYQKETADIRGKSEAERAIESGRSRIQLYNEFFDLCAGVQAKEAQIDAINASLSMNPERKAEAITAARIARGNLIADYNSRAARSYTAARFKDAKLPFRLPREPYEGQKTTCSN